jgi:hypothetical protein
MDFLYFVIALDEKRGVDIPRPTTRSWSPCINLTDLFVARPLGRQGLSSCSNLPEDGVGQ